MPGRTTCLYRWLFLAGLFCCSSCQSASSSTFENKTGQNESKPRVFSPRMDYDEWTPLGRGDPLKNNPTFDYVPPVLDRVQYWLDSHTTEPSAKRDILVLGVTAKKTSPKIPEQFLKFVDGPKFTRSSHQQEVSYRNDFTGSTGAEPPKIVRTSNFRNGPIDYRNQNRIQSIPASYYPSPFYSEKTKPYTMMVPPPLSQGKEKIVSFVEPTQQQFNTQTEEGPVLRESQFYAVAPPSKGYIGQQHPGKLQSKTPSKYPPSNNSPIQTVSQVETIKSVYGGPSSVQPIKSKYESVTTPSVSFEKSNLIYQSTQTLAGGWPSGSHGGAPPSTPSTYHHASQYTRPTSDYSLEQYETIDHHAAASANHEVVVEQNANIIVDGNSNENEEVVLGQKGPGSSNTFSPATTSATTTTITTTTTVSSIEANTEAVGVGESSEKMHIVVANSLGNLDAVETSSSQEGKPGGAVAVVMPSNYSEKKSASSERPAETTGTTTTTTTTTTDLPEHWWSTMETKATRENASKIESNASIRNSVTGSSPILFPEASQPVFHKQHASLPAHSTMPAAGPSFSSRHPVDSLLTFGPPQPPLSSMLHHHAQLRPNHQHHASMHFLGSMRPSLGFRAPASMPMFPPMTHMHAPPPPPPPPPPPITSTIDHRHVASSSMITDQSTAHRNSPQQQHISGAIVNSPTPTSSTNGGPPEDRFSDRHRPRLPDTTTSIYTTPTVPPFLPTAVSPSLDGNSSVPVAHQTPRPKPTSKGSENGEEAKDEAEGGGEGGQRKKVSSSEHVSTSTQQITTVPSLTTDPIFSHYKQPAKPIRGPMYLIIQGHSKVKTYKPTVSKHGVPVERNEIGRERGQISEFEQFVQENTRGSTDPTHGNSPAIETTKKKKKKAEEMQRAEKLARARQNDLMSLVQSGLGSLFTVSPSSSSSSSTTTSTSTFTSSSTTTEDERQANSAVTTIEINGN